MSRSNSLFTCQAIQVGEKAGQFLARSDFRGRLRAVFSLIVYLEGENGDVFWIAGEDIPLHQRSLIISYSPDLFSAGEFFCRQGVYLRIGDQVYIFLGQASLWKPSPLSLEKVLSLPELVQTFQNWRAAFLKIDAPWRQISHLYWQRIASSPKEKINAVLEISEKLIGLGPGLSPAGDDFVGGLLFVLHFLKNTYPDYVHLDEKKVLNFLAWARLRTNLISWTILKDLATGQGPEPVHNIMDSLLQGKDPSAIYPEVNRLAKIGHTTGQVIFYGIITGLLLILGGGKQKYMNLKNKRLWPDKWREI